MIKVVFRWFSGSFWVVFRWSVEQSQQPELVSHLQLFRGAEGELGLPAEQQWNCSFWRNEVLLAKHQMQQKLLGETELKMPHKLLRLYLTRRSSKLPFGSEAWRPVSSHFNKGQKSPSNCRCVSGASKTCPSCSTQEKPLPISFVPPHIQRCWCQCWPL